MTKLNSTQKTESLRSIVATENRNCSFVASALLWIAALLFFGAVAFRAERTLAESQDSESSGLTSSAVFDSERITSRHLSTGIAITPSVVRTVQPAAPLFPSADALAQTLRSRESIAITLAPYERIRIPITLPERAAAWKISVQVDGWWQVLDVQIAEATSQISSTTNPVLNDKASHFIAEREWRPRLDELVTELRGGQAAARHYERELFFISNRNEVFAELTNRSQSQSIQISKLFAAPILPHSQLNAGNLKQDSELQEQPSALGAPRSTLGNLQEAQITQEALITEYLSTQDSLRLLEVSRRLQSDSLDSAHFVRTAMQSWLQYAKDRGVQCISVPVVFRRGSLYASAHVFKRPLGNVPHSPDSQLLDESALDRFPSIDLVEQIYLACHDTGILFCPVIDLSFPIYELEALRSKVVESAYDPTAKPSATNVWNPQSDQVHAALRELLEEIPKRYSHQPGYSGFAVTVDPNSAWWIDLDSGNLNKELTDKAMASIAERRFSDSSELKVSPKPLTSKEFQNWQTEQILGTIANSTGDVARIYGPSSVHSLNFSGRWQYLTVENVMGSTPRNMLSDWWNHGIRSKCYSLQADGNRERYYFTEYSVLPSLQSLKRIKPLPRSRAINSPDRLRVWQGLDEPDQSLCMNANPWSVKLNLQWNKHPGTIRILGNQFELETSIDTNATTVTHEFVQTLPPSSLLRLGWSNRDAELVGWNNANDRTIEHVETLLGAFETALTSLSVPQAEGGLLFNGGFEHAPADGSQQVARGWATSLNPNATFQRLHRADTPHNEVLVLNTRGVSHSAWLQTEAFELDRNRLQVSAWLNVAGTPVLESVQNSSESTSQPSSISSLKVSVLAWNPKSERYDNMFTQDLSPTRHIENGWQQWNADLSGFVTNLFKDQKIQPIKLHWQLTATGIISLDNLNATSDFLQESERIELRNRLFVAKQSLKEVNIEPAIRLLEHSWPRLLRTSPGKLLLPMTSSLRRQESPLSEVEQPLGNARVRAGELTDGTVVK